MNNKNTEDKPASFKLAELKPTLQVWASQEDRSMHYLVRRIIEEALIKKFGYPPDHFKKIRLQRRMA